MHSLATFTSHIVSKPQRVLPSHKSTVSNIRLSKHISINQLRTSGYMTVLSCTIMYFAQFKKKTVLKTLLIKERTATLTGLGQPQKVSE